MQALFGQLLVGLINGSFYAMLSLGLAIIFGLLGITNIAQGAFYMLGAFTAWMLLRWAGLGYFVAIILAPVIVGNVMRRLADINARMGVGLILVEQNVPATLKVVEQTIILRSGRIVFQGSAVELGANADLWKWF